MLANHLRALLRDMPSLRVYSSNAAVVLEETQVIPDIQAGARMSPPPESWDDAPRPVLVVEVLSEVTRRRDLVAKRTLYVEAGMDYWIVDPDQRAITVVSRGVSEERRDFIAWRPAEGSETVTIDIAAVFREALD